MAGWSKTMDEKGHIMAAEFAEMETGGRPLIRGKVMANNNYRNTLSSREMDSLTALCDTFLPSLRISDDKDSSKATFYRTSASMAGTPQRLGELLSERLKHPKLFMARLALWVLSTRIGTLFLCGIPSFSAQFPYFQKFSQISPQKREEIVIAWSRSFLFLFRLLFTSLKVLILLVFFTQVDENEENPSWKAMGYCGPDPDFKRKTQRIETFKQMLDSPEDENQEEKCLDQLFGPLYKGVVYLDRPKQFVFDRLQDVGISVSVTSCGLKGSRSISVPTAFEIKCDAVVVGSGSGGGLVAGILANAGYKVVVLEKGSYSARTNLSLLEGSTMDQMYLGNGLLASKKMEVQFLAGSTVGGGSAINWSASIRTPFHVLKEWSEAHELELFDSKLYREALDVVCEKMGVQSEINDEGFNNMVLRKGCQELGYPVKDIPRNAPRDHYCGWCCLGCKDGRKKSTSETWLLDLVNSGNGVILPQCEAIQILHEKKNKKPKKQAIGVAFKFQNQGREELCIVKSKVTIVACGALSTPKLLKESGLKNPNIGKNLHIHPVAMAWGYFPHTTGPDLWPEAKKTSYEGGIMTAMSTIVGNFERSGYGAVIQTPALHPGMFSALMPWVSGRDIKDRMCKFSRTAHIFALARDVGSGEVVSPHEITYNMDKIDEENIKAGLEKVLRILAHAGAEEIGTHHVGGRSINVKKVSYTDFDKFVKEESARSLKDLETPICSAHQMGSCRMGVDPNSSAVNPAGETWEIEGLYVADTSVFPTALGVNPMITVQAISYCTAQSVLESLKRRRDEWRKNSIFSKWESEV